MSTTPNDGWVLVPAKPTPEMVAAYLAANSTYWKEMDEGPEPIGKWRNGTPAEATAESYVAMLAAAPVAPANLLVKRSLIESAIYTIQQSDTSSGCCMCGDSMSTHDNGMHSGHAPCDSGDYHAQGVLKELREALS